MRLRSLFDKAELYLIEQIEYSEKYNDVRKLSRISFT